jgi:single-strand DNA-binding protein
MLNRIILMGRLTRDPELRHTQTGTAVASFSLAVDRDFKDRNSGERATDFIDIVAWRATAEFVSRYFTKGRMAVVEGRLQIRDWTDKEGGKRRSAEVIADNVYFGDSKRDSDSGGASYGSGFSTGGYHAAPTGGNGGYAAPAAPTGYGAPVGEDQFAELSDDDGELPF